MQLLGIPHASLQKMESLKNGGSWGKFWWKTCGFEWVKGSLYPKIAACHISGNTLNILTKFCTYLVYKCEKYLVCKIWVHLDMCCHGNQHLKKLCKCEFHTNILSQHVYVGSWNYQHSWGRMSLHTMTWFQIEMFDFLQWLGSKYQVVKIGVLGDCPNVIDSLMPTLICHLSWSNESYCVQNVCGNNW